MPAAELICSLKNGYAGKGMERVILITLFQ